MKTVYIHIGRGKTGTTFLQGYLAKNREDLLRYGVDYVFADDAGQGAGHQSFAKSFIRDMPDYMTPALHPDIVRRQIAQNILASNAHTIVVSSENFILANKWDIHRYFSNLIEPFSVKIILFVRSQDELAESEYNQMVKLKRETCSFAEYANEKIEDLDYHQLAASWEHVFGEGNVLCKVYDAAAFDGVDQFLSLFPELSDRKIEPPAKIEDYIENRSLGFKTLTALRLLNAVELENRKELYTKIIQELKKDDIPALLFDSKSAREFRDQFSASNRAFCAHYLGKECDDLGGRRYNDQQRDAVCKSIEEKTRIRY